MQITPTRHQEGSEAKRPETSRFTRRCVFDRHTGFPLNCVGVITPHALLSALADAPEHQMHLEGMGPVTWYLSTPWVPTEVRRKWWGRKSSRRVSVWSYTHSRTVL